MSRRVLIVADEAGIRAALAQLLEYEGHEVKAVAKPVLRHRVLLRPELELEGATTDAVLDGILISVPAPR